TTIAVLMMLVPVAWGADVEGKIRSVDPSGKMVTLDDGTQLMIPPTDAGEKKVLQPGASVKASYEEKDGHKMATSFMGIPVRAAAGRAPRALDSRLQARDKVAMNLLRPIDRTLSVKGLTLHLLDWGGEGRTPLLLLHGFTGHAHAWDTLSIALQP